MTTKKNAGKSTAPKKAAGTSAKTSAKKEAKSARKSASGKPTSPPAKPASPKAPPRPAKSAKASVAKAPPTKPPAAKEAPSSAPAPKEAPAPAASAAKPKVVSASIQQILDAENASAQIAELGAAILDGTSQRATNAAKTLADLAEAKLEAVVPVVDKFAKSIASKNKRVAQTSADALPSVARVAPARVARHLELLRASFPQSSPVGKDGLVRTFAALCTASVAYQKRLEPVLTHALGEADGKMLLRWSQIVLPALKGEPHARARAVVEARLDRIPRAYAQQIADFLGIKLRARYR